MAAEQRQCWELGTGLRALPLSALRAVLVSLQNGEASLFEVNIRYIGGLLATYYLTGEEVCPLSVPSECPL